MTPIASAILFALLSILPRTEPVEEGSRPAVVQLDHYHDIDGKHLWSQLIWLDWHGEEYRIRDWRMVKGPQMLPVRTPSGYVSLWQDGEVMRRVEAEAFIETWSQAEVTGDPELLAREVLPKDERRGLRQTKYMAPPSGAIRPGWGM